MLGLGVGGIGGGGSSLGKSGDPPPKKENWGGGAFKVGGTAHPNMWLCCGFPMKTTSKRGTLQRHTTLTVLL